MTTNDEVLAGIAARTAGDASLKRFETCRYRCNESAWRPSRVDPKRCRASVSHGRSPLSYQCQKPAHAATDSGGPIEWCTTHSPASLKKRREKGEAKYQAERDVIERRSRAQLLAKQVCQAMLDDKPMTALALAQERAALLTEEPMCR